MATSKVHIQNMQKGWNQGSVCTKKWRCVGYKAFPELEKGSWKDESTCQQWTSLEAELLASTGETVVLSCNVLKILKEAKTRKPSKHFFAALTTYANSTFLILWTSASWLNLLFHVVGKILKNLSVRPQRMHLTLQQMPWLIFFEAVGVWVDELQVNQVCNAPFFSFMADECVDVANTEEENSSTENWCSINVFRVAGLAEEEGFAMQEACRYGLWWSCNICWEEIRCASKNHAPHLVFIHCHSHKLVQSANRTEVIKQVYTALTTLWKILQICFNCEEMLWSNCVCTWKYLSGIPRARGTQY